MKGLLEEIIEIPEKAHICYQKNQKIKLPLAIPYLGMGSSYYAPLTLFYCGKDINPQIASEYYYYLSKDVLPLGVLISQSGETSETIWNLERFKKVVIITNNPDSSLGKSRETKRILQLYAGLERFPSTKTFINTLIILYLGLGINPLRGIRALKENLNNFKKQAQQQAMKIYKYITSIPIKGLYIIGSGSNVGTAYEGALTLSETTKLSWVGMPASQYDHGPKETAQNSVIIILNSSGKGKKRIELIKRRIKTKSNALIIELVETTLSEKLSPLTFSIQLNFIMNYLADYMNIKDIFQLGEKITAVPITIK